MSDQDQTIQNQLAADNLDERMATHDVLDTAAADGNLTRFLAAISKAGVEDLLRGPNLITVFMPANETLDQSGTDLAGGLDAAKTADIVRNHIVAGAVSSVEAVNGRSLNTLQGLPLHVVVEGGDILVGGARILRGDIPCTNGVLHIVDHVLMP